MSGNREYKSDVFSMLMEDPARALQLYNAVNGTTYDDPAQVEIKTLDGGISLSIRNDAAFIVDARLSIYEHQSTICPNMPIRSLIYFTTIVQEMVRDRNIYGRKLIPIPMPQFVVFYNGDANQPERQELHLSDAFAKETDNPQLELKCQVYNINRGKNEEMLRACKWLEDYMTFVNKVRELHGNRSEEDLIVDIEMAIDYCVERNILRDFLISHRAEVTKSMKMDYTFDRQIELERDDAWTEGREEGRAEGREEGRAEGREEGRAEGREEGRAEGREEGADQLFTAVQRLRQGTMEETLLAEGFAQNIIDKAKRLM